MKTNSPGIVDEIARLAAAVDRPVRLMEVCGTHTMSAFRSGLRSVLPHNVTLLSGPGCPVCVTPNSYLDRAISILEHKPEMLIATFGDMIRVPGSRKSFERARAEGRKVKVVYSALDALEIARNTPDNQVVFIGVGFETTAPGTAWAIAEAARCGVPNFSVLCAHKTMPQAMAALLEGGVNIDAFICPGHVSVITGSAIYDFIAEKHGIPCVVTGFEPADMLHGIEMCLRQIADGRAAVEIQYSRAVTRDGNHKAKAAIAQAFEPGDSEWRGMGVIPGSGLSIRPEFAAQDAARVFSDVAVEPSVEPKGCSCGEVLRGVKTPKECALFRRACTPDNPIGACMVSSEGACAAHYRYS